MLDALTLITHPYKVAFRSRRGEFYLVYCGIIAIMERKNPTAFITFVCHFFFAFFFAFSVSRLNFSIFLIIARQSLFNSLASLFVIAILSPPTI